MAYEDHHGRLEAAEDRIRLLEQTVAEQERKLAEKDVQLMLMLDQYRMIQEHCMAQQITIDAAAEHAGLPWDVKWTLVSYTRLSLDAKFKSNIRAMTGFWSVEALDDFFDVTLGWSNDVLPCRYTTGRSEIAGHSTTSRDEHKNYMLFALYVLRTGPTSFTLAGMLFGFDKASASRWSPSLPLWPAPTM